MTAIEAFCIELLKLIIAAAPGVIEAVTAVKNGTANPAGNPLHKQVSDILTPALKEYQDAGDIFTYPK